MNRLSGILLGSALFAKIKRSLGTEILHFIEILNGNS